MTALNSNIRAPFLSTNPSTTGVTLAVERPISMTSADPFPAANLRHPIESRTRQKHMNIQSTPGKRNGDLLTRLGHQCLQCRMQARQIPRT